MVKMVCEDNKFLRSGSCFLSFIQDRKNSSTSSSLLFAVHCRLVFKNFSFSGCAHTTTARYLQQMMEIKTYLMGSLLCYFWRKIFDVEPGAASPFGTNLI